MASFNQDLSSALGILKTAISRSFKGLGVLIPLTVLVGGVGRLMMWQAGMYSVDFFVEPAQQANPQVTMFASEIAKLVVQMIWGVMLFPIIDAASIYVWREVGKDKPARFGSAMNWALIRYKRMFGPHAAAFLTITLGMTVLVPGVLFGLMYAFTDAISATDPKAKRPVARSEKLTRGRRRRIALTWMPYALWGLPSSLLAVYYVEGLGWWAVALMGCVDMFLLQIMEMAMYGLYEERIDDARKALAAKKASESAEEQAGEAAADATDATDASSGAADA